MSGKDKKAIHPNLRSAVFRIAIMEGSNAEYEAVKQEFLTTTSIDGKELALVSMGRVQSPELAEEFINFLYSDHVAIQDVHSGGASLAANPKTRLAHWEYIKTNWTTLREKLGGNMVVVDRLLRVSLNKFASREIGQDIAKFFEGKDNRGYDRGLGIVADTVSGNASYKERDEVSILEWLGKRDYL